MSNNKITGCRSLIILPTVLIITFFSFLFSVIAFAVPPPNPSEQSIPVQLRLIRGALDDMKIQIQKSKDDLSAQMTTMEVNLSDQMDTMEVNLSDQMTTMDSDLKAELDYLYIEVTTDYIELTTELCFDLGIGLEGKIGAEGELGAGWTLGANVKITAKGDAGLAGGLGLGNEVCINVPLYSVASMPTPFTATGDFDELVGYIAWPSQQLVPMIADLYTTIMPSALETQTAVYNLTNPNMAQPYNSTNYAKLCSCAKRSNNSSSTYPIKESKEPPFSFILLKK
ncbi:MAG: hypothetical protein KZQ83_13560 [gamma proteobacterium symbiont of Taylorina sp.]|nr:hypothetical protein [gamma proteobacterium symbiont of Taylorina sp.]